MRLSFIIIGLFISTCLFSQNYQEQFITALQENDTTKQLEILQAWEIADKDNPELFTSYFNYHFMRARQEVVTMLSEPPKGEQEVLVMKDSMGNDAGYFGSDIIYKADEITKAISKIDEGIALYPNRLDMRFGKAYLMGQIENWKLFTSTIVATVKYSAKNGNQWTWSNGVAKADGENFLLSSIQGYQIQLYNQEDDDLLTHMQTIANEVLKVYPNQVESLSNLSIVFLLKEKYNKALDALFRAEKIAPEDFIVLANIAQAYKLKGDKAEAIKYYEKTAKYGDEGAKQYAEQQIKELKK